MKINTPSPGKRRQRPPTESPPCWQAYRTLRGGKRDRALLTLGFAGAFRRSELVALEVADLALEPDGLRIQIRHSKTDQEGQGHEIATPRGETLRPVAAVQAWFAAAKISDGPVFRSINRHGRMSGVLTAQSVALIVKFYPDAAGLDPRAFAGHSLRAGFLTSAAEAGADVLRMMEVSRHKRVETVQGYVRRQTCSKGMSESGSFKANWDSLIGAVSQACKNILRLVSI